jgi:hypothetical protein
MSDGAVDGGCVESRGCSGYNRAPGPIPAGEQPEDPQSQPYCPVFQLPWCASAQDYAQDQTQDKCSHMDQLPLEDVLSSAQMAAPQADRFVAVGEAALHQFTAPSQQAFAVVAFDAPPVLVDRLLLFHLALPVPFPFCRFSGM